MFMVQFRTIESLFVAQRPDLRGRLRLDISSRRFPRTVTEEIDVAAAAEAVGERVVRLMLGLANDAALLKQARDWRVTEQLPKPDSRSLLCVMPDSNQFESYVVARLDEQLGLDPHRHKEALGSLASDFFQWADAPRDKADAKTYGISVDENQVFVYCRPRERSIGPAGSFRPAEIEVITPPTPCDR